MTIREVARQPLVDPVIDRYLTERADQCVLLKVSLTFCRRTLACQEMKFSALDVGICDRERDHQNGGSSDNVCLSFNAVMSVDAAALVIGIGSECPSALIMRSCAGLGESPDESVAL